VPSPRRSLPPNPFYGSIRRGGIHPSRALSATVNGQGGQRAGRPTTPLENLCRAGCPHPAEACRQIPFTVQSVGEGFIPPGLCAHIAAQHKKAGANISFAPAVLLLRSHSLITLFVIFRTASTSSWESSYRLRILIALSGSY